ncbi:LOW QUALITY PROTEIN: hypothetical protein YC2023_093549 [Brassica napus]
MNTGERGRCGGGGGNSTHISENEDMKNKIVMRPNPADEYTITELNQMSWSFDSTPYLTFSCCLATLLAPLICENFKLATPGGFYDEYRNGKKLTGKLVTPFLMCARKQMSSLLCWDVVAFPKVKMVVDALLDEAEKNSYNMIVLHRLMMHRIVVPTIPSSVSARLHCGDGLVMLSVVENGVINVTIID